MDRCQIRDRLAVVVLISIHTFHKLVPLMVDYDYNVLCRLTAGYTSTGIYMIDPDGPAGELLTQEKTKILQQCIKIRSLCMIVDVLCPSCLSGMDSFPAYCDMVTDGGGWTIIASYTGNDDEQPLVRRIYSNDL